MKEQLKKEEIAKSIEKDNEQANIDDDDEEDNDELISTETKKLNTINEVNEEKEKKKDKEKEKELTPEEARKKKMDEKNKTYEEKK